MSSSEDQQVLEEFELWRETRISDSPDVSVAAFLKEREHGFNAARIAEALGVLNSAIPDYEREAGESGLSALEDKVLTILEDVRAILEGDRPYDEVRRLTDVVPTRVYR